MPRPLVALSGRSGAGWGRSQGVFPGWKVGGRRPRWRSAAPGEAIFARTTFPRLPPVGCKLRAHRAERRERFAHSPTVLSARLLRWPKDKVQAPEKNPIGKNLRVSVRFVYQVSSDSTRCQESESLINLKKNRRPSAHHRGRIRAAGSTPAARTLTDPRAHRVPRTALAPARCRSYDYLTTSTQRTETHLDKNHKNPPVDLLRYTYPLSRSSS